MQILVIGYIWPEPQSSAAGSRMMQLLEFFGSTGSTITFATTAAPTPFQEDIIRLGIKTAAIELNSSSFDTFILELQPEVVVFDRFMMEEQFGWRIEKFCPDALKILDTEDLHFLRNYRERKFKDKKLTSFPADSEIAKREIASIYRCDISLIISEVEMQLLSNDLGIPSRILFYLPFLFNEVTSEEIELLPKFEERKDFICIGNFKHPPNVDAVIYLQEKIWPLIHKELPDAQMLIYGAYPSAKINSLHKPQNNFHIKGRAKDAFQEVKKAKVCIAPIRFGAGLKGKLTEAMRCGTPSVTTPVGAEGIVGTFPWSGEISSEPAELARAATDLYTDKEKWLKARDNGFTIIQKRFSHLLFYDSFQSRIQTVLDQLEKHRMENFTGQMLQHHRVKSTYFLSKYIEVKRELEELKSKPPL